MPSLPPPPTPGMSGHGGMSPRGGLTHILVASPDAPEADAGPVSVVERAPLSAEDIERIAPTAVGTAGARVATPPEDDAEGDGMAALTARTALQRILEAFAGAAPTGGARTVSERDRALRSLESLLAARAERARNRGDGGATDAATTDLRRLERLLEMNRELDAITGLADDDDGDAPGGGSGDDDVERGASGWNEDASGRDGAGAGAGAGASNNAARSLGVDLQVAARWLEQTVPVGLILLAVYSFRNARCILVFAWCFGVCVRLNDAVKAQVAARSERKPRDALYVMCVVAMTVTCAYAVLPEDGFWDRIAFKTLDEPMPFAVSVWQCASADALARFASISAKAAALLASHVHVGAAFRAIVGSRGGGGSGSLASIGGARGGGGKERRRGEASTLGGFDPATSSTSASTLGGGDLTHRSTSAGGGTGDATVTTVTTAQAAAPGRVPVDARGGRSAHRRLTARLSLLEHASLLHRTVLPIPVWFAFFRDETELSKAGACLAAGAYLAVKLRTVLERVAGLRTVARLCWNAEGAAYGVPASPEDVAESGDCCAICQERYDRPVRLGCRHVFCEECVGEWFERERTCPLCRATVASAGARSYGDGGTVMYAHVF